MAPDGACEWRRSPGGLVSALHPLLRHTPATWVGWAGGTGPAPALPDVGRRPDAHRRRSAAEDLRDHYEGFANATLWPLYHDAVEQPEYHRRWWEAYQRVNQRFAEAAAEVAEPGAVVWVQDYHLQLVPGMLRALRPDLRIGFFLHVPFPPPELFMQLPRRAELLRGMLGADLVGFQRAQAAHNFAQLATRVLGAAGHRPTDRHRRPGRCASARSRSPSTSPRWRRWPPAPTWPPGPAGCGSDLGDPRQVILSVDRMDYTKGIEQRLKAYSELLADGRRQGPRHGAGAGRGAEPGTGRRSTRSCATGSSARSAGSTASSAGSASRRSTTSPSRSTGPSWPRSTGSPT